MKEGAELNKKIQDYDEYNITPIQEVRTQALNE
jgi:hypothetical protein